MASQSSVYGQFERALDRGSAPDGLALARELPQVNLADALSLCLIQRHDDQNYMRFAVRWHSRAVAELGCTSLHESTVMLTALASLTSADAPAGLATLRRVFEEHGRTDLVKVLDARCQENEPVTRR